MSRQSGTVLPFARRPAGVLPPVMMMCPVTASKDISEAIAMLWELRDQLAAAAGLRTIERTRFTSLGRHVEDRLERVLHSMERLP